MEIILLHAIAWCGATRDAHPLLVLKVKETVIIRNGICFKSFCKMIKMMMLLNGGRTRTQREESRFYRPNNVQVCPLDNVLSRMK